MFNRKLKERVARLERLVDGQKAVEAGIVGAWPYVFWVDSSQAEAGLRDQVSAIANKLGVEFTKTPDTLGTWVAVNKAKKRK